MFDVLCYGDSNTWGFNPKDGSRFDAQTRWPGVMQIQLGSMYKVIENGINGRTTVFDNPFSNDYQNGIKGLGYALNASKPLDAVIIMLGTNDLNYTDAEGVYKGLHRIINFLINSSSFFKDTTLGSSPIWKDNPKILLVSPIRRERKNQTNQIIEDKRNEESNLFSIHLKRLADELNVSFLDAANIASPSSLDGLHMDEENHEILGLAIADKIKEIFE